MGQKLALTILRAFWASPQNLLSIMTVWTESWTKINQGKPFISYIHNKHFFPCNFYWQLNIIFDIVKNILFETQNWESDTWSTVHYHKLVNLLAASLSWGYSTGEWSNIAKSELVNRWKLTFLVKFKYDYELDLQSIKTSLWICAR